MQNLIDRYSVYDVLNRQNPRPLVKILVSYVKPSFLFKTDILTPIHLGRAVEREASKDGIVPEEGIRWLHEHCIGDDGLEGNISSVNRRVGFLTGTYWAWKNYDKLGDPEYFGSFGYRRILDPVFLEDLSAYDIILPYKRKFNLETIREQFLSYHGRDLYDRMIEVFDRVYPQEKSLFVRYLQATSGYFDELYVAKKDVFFDFCRWIFPLVFEYLKYPPVKHLADKRDVGFIAERLTGYYCDKVSGSLHVREVGICLTQKPRVNRALLNRELLLKLKGRMQK